MTWVGPSVRALETLLRPISTNQRWGTLIAGTLHSLQVPGKYHRDIPTYHPAITHREIPENTWKGPISTNQRLGDLIAETIHKLQVHGNYP